MTGKERQVKHHAKSNGISESEAMEDIALFDLKQRLMHMINDYNSRAYALDKKRVVVLGENEYSTSFSANVKIPKLELRHK